MKLKLTLLFIVVLCLQYTSAQKLNPTYTKLPVYCIPKNTEYLNYESYGLYVHVQRSDSKVSGFYNSPRLDRQLKSDEINPDFKIIVSYISFSGAKANFRVDSATISTTSISAQILAYDKKGKCFFNKPTTISNRGASIPGDYSKLKDDEKNALLTNALVENTLSDLLSTFASDYLIDVCNPDASGVSIANFWAFNPKGVVEEVMTKVEDLSNSKTPEELIESASQQIPFWEGLAELPENEENINKIYCGQYNLALIHYILGNQDKSDLYFEKALAHKGRSQKYSNSHFTDFRKKTSPSSLIKPDITSFEIIHEASMIPVKDMNQTLDEYFYLVLSGTIKLKDDTVLEGKCMVSRISEDNKEGGQIYNLSGSEYMVKIRETNGAERELLLSKIHSVTTDNVVYLCLKSSVLKSEYKSDKVSLYRKVFPSVENEFDYQKGDGKLESKPLFGSTSKWQMKFFADCPVLVEKIKGKELEDPKEMVLFYDQQCK